MLDTVTIYRVFRDIKFDDWVLALADFPLRDGWLISLHFNAVDDGRMQLQSTRKWYVSPHSTESELVQTIFKAIITAFEHEVREKFLYRGKPIFGPHFDVNELADRLPAIQIREPKP